MASEPVEQAGSPPAKKARTEEPELEKDNVDNQEEPTDESEHVSADLSGSEGDDDDQDDDFSDEEEDDMDDDMDTLPPYSMNDFTDIEITEEQLENFNNLYIQFIGQASEQGGEDNVEPIMLVKANTLRPIPQTLEEFQERMTRLDLSNETSTKASDLLANLMEASEKCEQEILGDSDDKEPTDEEIAKLHDMTSKAQVEVYSQAFDDLPKDNDRIYLEILLIFCDGLFDTNESSVWLNDSILDQVKALLEKVNTMWKALFTKSDEELHITEQQRTGLKSYLMDLRNDLLHDQEEAGEEAIPEATVAMLKAWNFDF